MTTATQDKYIRAKQVKEITSLSMTTIYRKIDENTLPSYKIGGARVFKLSEVMAFMDQDETATAAP